MTRVAIYARYSSDLQSEASIEDQIRLCRENIERDGHTEVQAYTDYAISGSSLHNRPGMQTLLADAKSGSFDLLVAEALDRISRDQEDVAAIFKRLTHANVRIVTLAEGEINELHVGLKGTMNALFLKDLAAKTRRGQRGRVEAGKIPGGNSYGYRIVRALKEDGTMMRGEREIDTEQATIVRRIFTEYVSGQAPRLIAKRLNAEGVTAPRGGHWNASTINGSRQRRNGILNNELYVGRIVYNRQRFVKDPDTGRRISRLNPEKDWVRVDVPDLRIVDEATWANAQALKSRYASYAGNKRQTKKRLLSGLIKCGVCGGGMTIARRDRYYCSARREKGTCNSDRGIAAGELEDRVLKGLEEILVGNEHLVAIFVEEFKTEVSQLRKQRHGRERALTKDLQKVERGIERCLQFIVGGNGNPGSVGPELTTLEHRKAEIEAELTTKIPESAVEVLPNLPELYRRKVAALRDLLSDDNARAEAFAIIRSLIERIEVHPGEKRGECGVVLIGALAAILEFVQQRRTAAPCGGGGTFLMVAGVGFEPTTFRL
jgi:site-specific DNA recombinase